MLIPRPQRCHGNNPLRIEHRHRLLIHRHMFSNGDGRFQNRLFPIIIRIDSPDPAGKALFVHPMNGIIFKNQRVIEGNGHNAPVFPQTPLIFQIHRQTAANTHTAFHQVKRTGQEQFSRFNCRLGFQITLATAVQIQACHRFVAFQRKNALNNSIWRKQQTPNRLIPKKTFHNKAEVFIVSARFDQMGFLNQSLGHLGQQRLVGFRFYCSGNVLHLQPVFVLMP